MMMHLHITPQHRRRHHFKRRRTAGRISLGICSRTTTKLDRRTKGSKAKGRRGSTNHARGFQSSNVSSNDSWTLTMSRHSYISLFYFAIVTHSKLPRNWPRAWNTPIHYRPLGPPPNGFCNRARTVGTRFAKNGILN